MNDFNRWLQDELNKRGWSQGDAARKGGFSESMFSKVLNESSRPGPKFCRGIAKALGRAGGQVKSERKTATARANGRKGGRPRKQTD